MPATSPKWSALEDATLTRMRAEGYRMMEILPHLNGKTETQARSRIAELKLPSVSRAGQRKS